MKFKLVGRRMRLAYEIRSPVVSRPSYAGIYEDLRIVKDDQQISLVLSTRSGHISVIQHRQCEVVRSAHTLTAPDS